MDTRTKRIQKELTDIERDSSSGVTAEPINDKLTHLIGRFKGPEGTPYEGGAYVVDIVVPEDYPFVPLKVRFETRVWHPNVSSQTGAICLDILSKRWSPAMTLKTTLLSIQSLLATPEPADPQDAQAATELLNHPEAFEAKARLWARMYAGAGVGEGLTGPGGGNGGVGGNSAARKWRWEYPESLVRRFVEMGFEEEKVVGALRRVGVERGREEVEEGVAGRIVDELWS